MPALGDEFRSAREARGLTLSDVAEQIHIRSVYLNAIEHEEWSSIGAPVYVRGFMRTYARFLGLDGEDLVARFSQAVPPERSAPVVAPVHHVERGRTGPSLWAILGVVVAFALVILVGYEYWAFTHQSDGGSVALATPAPAPAASAQPGAPVDGSQGPVPGASGAPAPTAATAKPSTPAPHHQLAIRLIQRSWVRVAVDGTTQIEGIYPAGTTRTFRGNVADVRVGNAAGVTVSVNGRPAAALGKAGDVVEQRYTL